MVAVASTQADDDNVDLGEVLTLEQAARLLALSTRTLGRYVEEALIPYVRLPRRGAREKFKKRYRWDFQKEFKEAAGAAGLEDLHFHDLRHVRASVLMEAGTPDQVVSALTGPRGKTLWRYQHLSNEFRKQTVDLLADILLGSKSSDTAIDTRASGDKRASKRGQTKSHRTKRLDGRPVGTRTPDLYRVKVAL